jgi:heat shock protein 1/8
VLTVPTICAHHPWSLVLDGQAVAYGAAVQAAVLSGARDESLDSLLLIDVAPLTLGIEDATGLMSALVPRGTAIPTSKSKVYTTDHDRQTAVTNKVYEGERSLARDNRLIGTFE